MVLTRSQAKAFYDQFGIKQDAQGSYEDAALEDLIAHASFEQAEKVVELGCGTGRLASCLLSDHLALSASYFGMDFSQTMIDIAEARISPYTGRAKVVCSDGSMHFPLPDQSVDCVLSTYVLDLLSEADVQQAISEFRRVLAQGGKLCLVSLTSGVTIPSRIVSSLWSAVFRLHASLVGGCRPIQLDSWLDQDIWSIDYRNVISRFGIPSEVLIAKPKSASDHSLKLDVPL